MNLFYLHPDPVIAAQLQCDKHVVKMIVESAQMLSTSHRILDGAMEKRLSKSGKRLVKYWKHEDFVMEAVLYKAVHMGHPCTVWTMESDANYQWHYQHFVALCDEYKYRYGKVHHTDTILREMLKTLPKNIPTGDMTPIKLAMKSNPECMFPDDPVKSYRLYYKTKKDRFKMVWTNRETPEWFLEEPTKQQERYYDYMLRRYREEENKINAKL